MRLKNTELPEQAILYLLKRVELYFSDENLNTGLYTTDIFKNNPEYLEWWSIRMGTMG